MIAASRKWKHSIMSNSGFGQMTIHRPDGITIVVPQDQIAKKTGQVYKNTNKKLLGELTRENIELLESKGILLHIGGYNA